MLGTSITLKEKTIRDWKTIECLQSINRQIMSLVLATPTGPLRDQLTELSTKALKIIANE